MTYAMLHMLVGAPERARSNMRVDPLGGLPFLPLNLTPGFSERRPRPTDGAPFPYLGRADAPPRRGPEQELPDEGMLCRESENDAYTTRWWDACWRVLVSNPPRGDEATRRRIAERRRASLLGPTGHVERMNAWTHIVGGVAFASFAIVRSNSAIDASSAAGILSTYTAAVIACTFAVSTGFHTLGTVRHLAPVMRMFDHGAIDLALAVACTTDTAIVTLNFADVPWQTVADASGVAAVILCFFFYRRLLLPPEDTEIAWGSCRLGLFRLQHADFEYSALRSASYVVISFGFIMLVPVAWRNLTATASNALVACNAASLLLLILGLLFDNVLIWPDTAYQRAMKGGQTKPPFACHNKDCGCVMTSHAFWHVFSLVAVTVQTVGREVALAEMS